MDSNKTERIKYAGCGTPLAMYKLKNCLYRSKISKTKISQNGIGQHVNVDTICYVNYLKSESTFTSMD